jgi:hypothetical protein
MKVIKSGDNIYLRMPWDNTYDLVEALNTKDSLVYGTDNKVFNPKWLALILKSAPDSNMFGTLIVLKYEDDDACPYNYNGDYIGGNHGANFAYKITVTAHDKTNADIGSEWLDSSNHKFYIVKIIDANNILILSENSSSTDIWSFYVPSGTTLTHSANATHTVIMNFTSPTKTAIFPAIKNQTKQYLLDGITPITVNGTYVCKTFVVQNNYEITHIPSLIEYLKTHIGTTTLDDTSMETSAEVQITYTYKRGCCTINSKFTPKKDILLNYVGFTQSYASEIPASGTLNMYIPKTKVNNGHDFKSIKNITSWSTSLEFTKAYWEDSNNPPDRFMQFAKDSGGNKYSNFGFMIGYAPIGIGNPSVRKNLIDSAIEVSASKKMYSKGISKNNNTYVGDIVPKNSTFEMTCFRTISRYALDNSATNISWYYVGNDIYLMLDYHCDVIKTLALPKDFVGKNIEVVEKTSTFTIFDTVVSDDGINIATTGGYAYAVLKLT